jgi:hypothetical protein
MSRILKFGLRGVPKSQTPNRRDTLLIPSARSHSFTRPQRIKLVKVGSTGIKRCKM